MLPSLAHLSYKNELEDTLRYSFGVNEQFKLMFLGGSPGLDSDRRMRFDRCKIITAGNHNGADLKGDWNDEEFWERIYQEHPTAIVIDFGSDSWMSDFARNKLASYVNDNKSILIFSPIRSDFASVLMTDHPLRYNMSIFGFAPTRILLTLWYHLPEREYHASAIFHALDCYGVQDADERKACFDAYKIIGPHFKTFDDAVNHQISFFSTCSLI